MRSRLLSLCLVFALAGCASDTSIKQQYQAEKLLYQAGKLFERVMINPRIANKADYDAAIAAYEVIIRKYYAPNKTIESVKKQSYIAAAQLWLLQGEVQAAISVYDRFLTAFPDDKNLGAFVHFANAQSNERIYNLPKAISEYQTLIDDFGDIKDPLKPNANVLTLPLKVARLKRSQSSVSNGHNSYGKAIAYYRSVIKQHSATPAAYGASYYLASIYSDQKQWSKAVNILRQIVRAYPDRDEIPNILFSIGNIYLTGLHNPTEASRIFDRLLQKYPGHDIEGYVHLGRARILSEQNKNEQARELLRWIIENYPQDSNLSASSQLTLASTYEAGGDWQRAIVEYRWVEENYPTTRQGLFVPTYIAEAYRRRNEPTVAKNAFADAISHYQNLVKKYPKTVLAGTAQEFVIYCYAAQQDWDQAAKAADALRQVHPGTRSEINASLFLGQIYEAMSDYNMAIDAYENFASQYPNHPLFSQVQDKISDLQQQM